MSIQQDIYAAGSESHRPMLNKENYVPWSSRLLRYAKSRPNGKLIHNFIINGPYVRRMIPEPSDTNRDVPVNETFHVQTDDELTEKELKQIEGDDQAIQTILLGLPEDIYAAVDSCEMAQEIWLRVQQMMKGSDIGIQEKNAKLFNEWERFTSNEGASIESYYHRPEWSRHVTIVHQTKDLHTADYTQLYDFLKYNQKEVDELKAERLAKIQDPLALMANSNNPYAFPAPHQDQPSFNQNYMQQPMPNPEDIIDPTTMVGGNGGNLFRRYAGQNVRNLTGYNDVQNVRNQGVQNAVQNPRVQNFGNQNGLIGVQGNGNQNQIWNDNLVATRAKGNAKKKGCCLSSETVIDCSEGRGRNPTSSRRDDLMAAAADIDEIEEVNANCILMANLQQASTSGTQSDKAPVYDSDGSAEVHENCDDNEIFNMFTQEEQYTELLKPIPESHQVPHNDNNVISENLAIEVEKVNTVNRKLKETNADLTTELARFKNQEKCFEISQEKYDKLERCYQQSIYQEQCLSKKINALHLSTGIQIITLNEQILDLNKQLSKEKSIVSFLHEEKKKLKCDFKTREDKLLDKQIQVEKKIKELNNILAKMGQSIQTIHMLSPKPDSFYHMEPKMALGYQNPFYLKKAQKKQQSLYDGKVLLEKHDALVVHDSEDTLQLAQESHEKMKQLKKEIKPTNYTKINHLSGVFVPQTAKSHEELYFSNISKTANVSKSISVPSDDFSDDTTPSVARKFLNEVKSTIVTLQRVVKHRMTIEPQNWSSSAHQELHKIVKDEISPIVNQVDARVQNFEIQFLKEATKFVGDFKSLTNKSNASLAKHKALELENERLLKAVVSQDIMNIVQKESVVDTSDLQTELEHMKEHFENFTSNSVSTPQESKGVNNDKVIFPGMFRINPFKTSREEKHMPNNVSASARTKTITVSQPPVFTKKDVNSNLNGLSSTGDVISKVVCAMCKKCLISVNHDPKVKKPKKVGLIERLATPKPRKPRFLLRWSPTGRLFDQDGKIVDSSESESQSNCSNGYPDLFVVLRLGLFQAHDGKSKASHQFLGKYLDHRVYFVEGLGYNLFSEHLCPSYEQGKCKRTSHPPKPIPNSRQRLHLLYMDLCGPMRIASINEYFDSVGISHQMSYVRTSQQDGVVERRNRTLVEAAITILIFSHAPLFLWVEEIATACFTQNCSIIHRHFNKTPYELINRRKPDISFLRVFGALCYPKNDREDIGKLGAKGDIGFFIGYSADSCAYIIYNQRTKKIIETMNVSFDELSVMAFEQRSLKPEHQKWSRHVTIVHQTKDLYTADYTQLYDILKYNQKEVDELKAERLAKTQDPLALMANSNNPYAFPAPHQDQPSFNQNYLQQPMPNPEDITDPTTAMNMALSIAQPGMNMGQDRQMQMVGGNGGNQFRQYAGQNAGNPAGYNDEIRNQNQIGNGNLVAVRAEGNTAGQNGNQIRCYNCRGVEEYDLMATTADLDEIEEVNANCILMANLQQASTSGTQTDSTPVYDSDGSAEVYENCDNNEIFNMFTQEEQYTELLEPIPESHQVTQHDNDVISKDTSVEQGGETVEQHPTNFEETRALYESLYQNLATKVEKVNSVNRKLKETNADLTIELARYKNQERCFEISQEKYDKLERCYQQSVYQEQCLSKKINALHLSFGKQIMTLNELISELNKRLSKEKSTVSFHLEEKKKLKSDIKACEDELLDK
nr:integrase, catalytic region, zinc finger, CCHC-type, peptidase aspartic, catalytic [Tanacetum cinerariifolium]